MPAHPTRRANRTRGLGGLAREPFALGIALAENPNRAKRHAPRLLDASDTESVALTLGVEPMAWLAASGSSTRDGTLTVSTPARDSRGRRNPRMTPSTYTV